MSVQRRLPVYWTHTRGYHEPRHQYDCGRCKFNWCCGPLCACFDDIGPPPPPKRAREVARLQRAWRIRVGLPA